MVFKYDHSQLWFCHKDPPIEGVQERWFYDEDFPFRKKLEEAYPLIRKEIIEILERGSAEIDTTLNDRLANKKESWQSFSFKFWNRIVSDHNCTIAPVTLSLLSSFEGLVSASVSILNPQSAIQPHRGNTNAIYRCHLPLLVPAGLPEVGFYVGYEERSWVEGKLLVFNDAAYHKAWNKTDQKRILLIVDIIRPEFLNQTEMICKEVLSSFEE